MSPEQMESQELWNTIRNYLCLLNASPFNKQAIECLDEMNKRVMAADAKIKELNDCLRKSLTYQPGL
jgi:hypothetical protein